MGIFSEPGTRVTERPHAVGTHTPAAVTAAPTGSTVMRPRLETGSQQLQPEARKMIVNDFLHQPHSEPSAATSATPFPSLTAQTHTSKIVPHQSRPSTAFDPAFDPSLVPIACTLTEEAVRPTVCPISSVPPLSRRRSPFTPPNVGRTGGSAVRSVLIQPSLPHWQASETDGDRDPSQSGAVCTSVSGSLGGCGNSAHSHPVSIYPLSRVPLFTEPAATITAAMKVGEGKIVWPKPTSVIAHRSTTSLPADWPAIPWVGSPHPIYISSAPGSGSNVQARRFRAPTDEEVPADGSNSRRSLNKVTGRLCISPPSIASEAAAVGPAASTHALVDSGLEQGGDGVDTFKSKASDYRGPLSRSVSEPRIEEQLQPSTFVLNSQFSSTSESVKPVNNHDSSDRVPTSKSPSSSSNRSPIPRWTAATSAPDIADTSACPWESLSMAAADSIPIDSPDPQPAAFFAAGPRVRRCRRLTGDASNSIDTPGISVALPSAQLSTSALKQSASGASKSTHVRSDFNTPLVPSLVPCQSHKSQPSESNPASLSSRLWSRGAMRAQQCGAKDPGRTRRLAAHVAVSGDSASNAASCGCHKMSLVDTNTNGYLTAPFCQSTSVIASVSRAPGAALSAEPSMTAPTAARRGLTRQSPLTPALSSVILSPDIQLSKKPMADQETGGLSTSTAAISFLLGTVPNSVTTMAAMPLLQESLQASLETEDTDDLVTVATGPTDVARNGYQASQAAAAATPTPLTGSDQATSVVALGNLRTGRPAQGDVWTDSQQRVSSPVAGPAYSRGPGHLSPQMLRKAAASTSGATKESSMSSSSLPMYNQSPFSIPPLVRLITGTQRRHESAADIHKGSLNRDVNECSDHPVGTRADLPGISQPSSILAVSSIVATNGGPAGRTPSTRNSLSIGGGNRVSATDKVAGSNANYMAHRRVATSTPIGSRGYPALQNGPGRYLPLSTAGQLPLSGIVSPQPPDSARLRQPSHRSRSPSLGQRSSRSSDEGSGVDANPNISVTQLGVGAGSLDPTPLRRRKGIRVSTPLVRLHLHHSTGVGTISARAIDSGGADGGTYKVTPLPIHKVERKAETSRDVNAAAPVVTAADRASENVKLEVQPKELHRRRRRDSSSRSLELTGGSQKNLVTGASDARIAPLAVGAEDGCRQHSDNRRRGTGSIHACGISAGPLAGHETPVIRRPLQRLPLGAQRQEEAVPRSLSSRRTKSVGSVAPSKIAIASARDCPNTSRIGEQQAVCVRPVAGVKRRQRKSDEVTEVLEIHQPKPFLQAAQGERHKEERAWVQTTGKTDDFRDIAENAQMGDHNEVALLSELVEAKYRGENRDLDQCRRIVMLMPTSSPVSAEKYVASVPQDASGSLTIDGNDVSPQQQLHQHHRNVTADVTTTAGGMDDGMIDDRGSFYSDDSSSASSYDAPLPSLAVPTGAVYVRPSWAAGALGELQAVPAARLPPKPLIPRLELPTLQPALFGAQGQIKQQDVLSSQSRVATSAKSCVSSVVSPVVHAGRDLVRRILLAEGRPPARRHSVQLPVGPEIRQQPDNLAASAVGCESPVQRPKRSISPQSPKTTTSGRTCCSNQRAFGLFFGYIRQMAKERIVTTEDVAGFIVDWLKHRQVKVIAVDFDNTTTRVHSGGCIDPSSRAAARFWRSLSPDMNSLGTAAIDRGLHVVCVSFGDAKMVGLGSAQSPHSPVSDRLIAGEKLISMFMGKSGASFELTKTYAFYPRFYSTPAKFQALQRQLGILEANLDVTSRFMPFNKSFHLSRVCDDFQCGPSEILLIDDDLNNILEASRERYLTLHVRKAAGLSFLSGSADRL